MPIPVSLGSKGSTGAAEVTVTSTKIRVVFQGTGQTIDVLREDAPDYMISGKQIVSLSGDNNRIFSAKPSGGSYVCKFIGLWSREGEPPTPKKVPAKSGVSKGKPYQIPEHLEFTALFEIQSPKKWKRYQLSQNLFYAFSEYEGGITQIKGNGSKKLEEFLQVCGMDFVSDDIPFSENVLPYVEKLLLERNHKVIISLNPDGWVDSIVPAPEDGDEPEYVEETKAEEPASTNDLGALAEQLKGVNPDEVAALLAQLGFEKK